MGSLNNSDVNSIFFPHRRHGYNAKFQTDEGIIFNDSMWASNQPNDILETEVLGW